ncbi:uncharacterized protein EV154DRAFT_553598 [Mucor mucedo]|uniref:uncharacterized protein n=1 Tax=Mucor mucedo TaxID=29922 RepID=UPI00221F72D4|nr:uncharacterized protein EV154DRAFT_553598 [Mucor mucedo]KAI7888752.1 hypothetical protein EV154DRAFT_553598 [Mucor mucedo]
MIFFSSLYTCNNSGEQRRSQRNVFIDSFYPKENFQLDDGIWNTEIVDLFIHEQKGKQYVFIFSVIEALVHLLSFVSFIVNTIVIKDCNVIWLFFAYSTKPELKLSVYMCTPQKRLSVDPIFVL